MRTILASVIAGIICFPAASSAYDLYIQAVKAPIYLAPDISSGKIAELEKGEKITGIMEKGYWHKVELNGKTGWIYKFMVKSEPPINRSSLYARLSSVFQKFEASSNQSRKRSSSYTATAAARGLKEKRVRFAQRYSLNYEAVEKMESIGITDDEAMEFLKNRGAK